MASGDETRRPSVTASYPTSADLEALFPEPLFPEPQPCGEVNPEELVRLRQRIQGWLWRYEPPLLGLQRLLVWERPLCSVCGALTLNTLFWLLSSTSLRPLFLLSVSLLGLMLLERWKHKLPLITVQLAEPPPLQREPESVEPRLLSIPELSHHLAESYLSCCLYLQEMLQYKRQNHGKFCAMMCSGCLVLAVVGHYVPGIMISYIIVLSVLLWPLVVYHELIQKMYTGLEPILMKLDYSMKGDTEHRKHDKRKVKKEVEEGDEPRAETESESEEELSCFAPTVDVKTTALAMAITDSELSDEEASILESGGFSVSRATTPQLTDVSEDLDQQSVHSDPEEAYLRDLPDFPSVEEFPSMERSLLHFPLQTQAGPPSEAEALSPASLLIQHLASPLHFVNTHFNGHGRTAAGEEGVLLVQEAEEGDGGRLGGGGEKVPVAPQRTLEALSEDIVSTAITTAVQNTLSALLRFSEASEEPSLAEFLPSEARPGVLDTTTQTTTTTAAMPAPAQDLEDGAPTDTGADEEMPDDTLAPTEEEDFELLDQSELEQMDEGRGFSSDGQAEGGALGAPDVPPSPQHQPET